MSEVMKNRAIQKFVTPLDPLELALRLLEAAGGLKRPVGSNIQVFSALDPEDQQTWLRASHAALEYFAEQINSTNAIN